jgi:DNA invertase Pin-like site-specific DNA recombinase
MMGKIAATHLERRAFVYVRQSSAMQVHENVESKRRQYGLAERAVALGWPRNVVEVIDEDQGKSGASTQGRDGFGRMAEAVGHGEAGAIFAVEVSRLARSSADWQRLLSLCAVTGVVVIDEQSVYDPANKDDRLLLDLKGTMSEAGLQWLRLRLAGGRLNKAKRGALWLKPPTGYVWRDGRFELDPDEAVRAAVRVAFERFAVEPSLWAVVRWAHETAFRFPTRRWYADGTGEVQWRPLTMGRLNALLHNPTYAGVYAFGRRVQKQVVVEGEIRHTLLRRTPAEWPVRLEQQHPSYIDWETYVGNQEKLRQNISRLHGATPGAPHRGPALLQGLMLCGRCGRRMQTFYSGTPKTRPTYMCMGKHEEGGPICWSVPGQRIDDAVERLFLEVMVPAEIDLSLAVDGEVDRQAKSLEHQWQARLEQARYEARRAERRYMAVDPDNRVVARTLERDWEQRLREVEEVERGYAEARRARHVELSAQDREAIRAMARDLRAVWRAKTTTEAERKAMLRLVIEAIAASPVEVPRRETLLRIQWKSGAVDELRVDRPASRAPPPRVLDRVRALLAEGLRDAQVAKQLNEENLFRNNLRAWTARAVQRLRCTAGIARVAPRAPSNRPLPDRHPVSGRYSIPGAARHFGVSVALLRRWVARGLMTMHREPYGRYNARWLDIDAPTAARLAELARMRRRQ